MPRAKKEPKIPGEFIEEFQNTPIGTEFTCAEIKSRIHLRFDRNEDSIIPSDYCYNRLNHGINYEEQLHLFEYLGRNRYKYLGINYPYTGKVFHKPKSGLEVCVGELLNGQLVAKKDSPITTVYNAKEEVSSRIIAHRTKREAGLSLRYAVLKRDHFKCCACGASPAKDPSVELHVDHIIPWSKGGETTIDNLQTLCSKCNLGKSDEI